MQFSKDRARNKRDAMNRRGPGFARRKNVAQGTWRETVTHYMPEPWLVALGRDRVGLPIKPGHRPGANR